MEAKEYIEREALRTEMYRQAFEEDSPLQRWDSGCWIRYKMFENAIDSAPAADVEPVRHGRWNEYDDDYGNLSCSVCENDAPNDIPWDYCPHCGAKMDEDG